VDVVIAILIAMATGIAVMEGYAWLDRLSVWLMKRAIRHIISEGRDRFEEEWRADLRSMPSSLFKIAYALTNFRKATARQINAEIIMAELVDELEEFAETLAGRFERANTRLKRVAAHLDKYRGQEGEAKYREIIESEGFTKVEQNHQQMGSMTTFVMNLHVELKEMAAQAQSVSAAEAWSARAKEGLDQLGAQLNAMLEALKANVE
jgi:hypothetical protein